MTINDLIKLYERKKKQFGDETFKHISEILLEAKGQHRIDFLKSKTAERARAEGRDPDHEQSWRSFKGKNLDKLLIHIIQDEIHALRLEFTTDNKLEARKLSEELSRVRRNLVVHFGKYDIVPDSDIVIYDPTDCEVIAVISSKVTLRERIAQTAYWKLKLAQDPVTKHIKSFFVTLDEDAALVSRPPAEGNGRGFKARIIVEYDTDGAYVLRDVEESEKVKSFSKLIDDLRRIVDDKRSQKTAS